MRLQGKAVLVTDTELVIDGGDLAQW